MLSKYKISGPFKCIIVFLLFTSQLPIVKGNGCSENATYVAENSLRTIIPIDESIAVAAPHLPAIQQFEGTGDSFKYKKNTYQYDERILKTWIQTYPEEFSNYCIAMKALLKDTRKASLSPIMKAIYTDLKAQYFMIKKITNI